MFQSNAQRILTLEWFEDGITLLAGGGDQPPAYSMSGKRPSNCTVSVKRNHCNEIAQVSATRPAAILDCFHFFPLLAPTGALYVSKLILHNH